MPPLKTLAVSALVAASVVQGQQMQMAMPKPPTVRALEQIDQVKQATKPLATQQQAAAAGFGPVLNWLPTMGVHWLNRSLQSNGKAINVNAPDQLMFSPINGKQTLVGAAYSYIVSLTDSTRPPTFDGNPAWHDHPQFAPEGETLAMVHVWFVASPDGPFAGHNPNLPFWAVGITPPDAGRFMDPAESIRIRKTALALAVVADTAGLFPTVLARPAVHDAVAIEREAIRTLIPQLDAKGVRDWTAWDHAADQAAAHWEKVRAAYLSIVRTPAIKERMVNLMDEMETGHHHM